MTAKKKIKKPTESDIKYRNAMNVIHFAKQIDEIYGTNNYKEGMDKYWSLPSKEDEDAKD